MVKCSTLIYAGHFLSSWGDRMWNFAIALFLLELQPDSLALSATYGLTLACAVLIFGPLVGDWIDRKPRLYCARVSLVVQNLAVILSATLLLVNRELGDPKANYSVAVKIFAILLGCISQLYSIAMSIIIQKDWIVVVAGGQESFLANLNSNVRRIDLVTKILAPLACGQIMALAELTGGAIFIMSWNAVSMIVEYNLLRAVYVRTPALANKPQKVNPQVNEAKEMVELHPDDNDKLDNTVEEHPTTELKPAQKHKHSTLRTMFSFLFVLKSGWKIYMSQTITLPCIGFSFLYMTVLGFGYISTAYAYNQCFSEFMVSLMVAGAGLTGIIGTFFFPVLRKKIGLIRTGLFAAWSHILSLIPCVVSIFVIGSPFFLLPENQKAPFMSKEQPYNFTSQTPISSTNFTPNPTTNYSTSGSPEESYRSRLFIKCLPGVDPPSSYLSVSLVFVGMIAARIGLWGFDLVITQMVQQNVVATKRGVFSGVQSSLNNFMDVLRFILVLVFPRPDQYGFLIILSVLFVAAGYFLYMIYARRERGHVLPHCKSSRYNDGTNGTSLT